MASNFERAKEVLAGRREEAEKAATKKRLDLEERSPELKELHAEMASAGLRAIQAIGKGEDAPYYINQLAKENLAIQQRRKELLAELGEPEDALDVRYHCSKCRDSGVVNGHYCDCFRTLIKQFQFESLNKTAPAKRSTFENFDLNCYRGVTEADGTDAYEQMAKIYHYCRSWAQDFDRNSPSLLLYGRTGLGKTHLSLAMVNVVIEKGYQCIYGSAQNLLNLLEKEKFGRLKDEGSPEEDLLTCDLLVIDDLGAEFTTSFTVAAIYNILNTRILTGLPTIISTNLMYDEIGDRYSERAYSRIIGNFTPLEFLGKDVRQLKS